MELKSLLEEYSLINEWLQKSMIQNLSPKCPLFLLIQFSLVTQVKTKTNKTKKRSLFPWIIKFSRWEYQYQSKHSVVKISRMLQRFCVLIVWIILHQYRIFSFITWGIGGGKYKLLIFIMNNVAIHITVYMGWAKYVN